MVLKSYAQNARCQESNKTYTRSPKIVARSVDLAISGSIQTDSFLNYSTRFLFDSLFDFKLLAFMISQVFSTVGYTLPLCALVGDSSLAGARNPAKHNFSSCHSCS